MIEGGVAGEHKAKTVWKMRGCGGRRGIGRQSEQTGASQRAGCMHVLGGMCARMALATCASAQPIICPSPDPPGSG